jgi:hypothetical protein
MEGLTSRAGTALLTGIADAIGLTDGLVRGLRVHSRAVLHEPGRIVRDIYAMNAAWLELVLLGCDLLSFMRTLLLSGTDLAKAEPKRLRYRLLHVAGRIVSHAKGVTLRLPRSWRWAKTIAAAFARLRALPPG